MSDDLARGARMLQRALVALLNAADGPAMGRALEAGPFLLDEGVDQALTGRIQRSWAQGAVSDCAGYLSARAFLSATRLRGAARALALFRLPLWANNPLVAISALGHDPADYARRAELAREALAQIRRASEPDLWATFQRELGDALVRSPGPGRSARLREAIGCYRRALQVWDEPPHAGGRAWAATQFALGSAWFALRDGDQAAQRGEAIACLERALAARDPAADPVLWAQSARQLALALTRLRGRERAADQARAIALLRAIVEAAPAPEPAGWPEEQGRAWVTLGFAHIYRLEGGRAVNLGLAHEAHREAERLLPRERHPADWARVQYNGAIALLEDPSAERHDRLVLAEGRLRLALEVLTPAAHPDDWALAQTALGTVLGQHEHPGPRATSLDEAIARYRAALTVFTEGDDRERWATLQNNLGNALAERAADAGAQAEALGAYRLALRGRPRREHPARWAETMNNLGVLYAERRGGAAPLSRHTAARCLRAALRIHTPAAFPAEARRAARNLGLLELAAGRWAAADEALATAIAAGDELYRAAISGAGRAAELGEGRGLYAARAYALAQEDRLEEAVACLEAGRARALAEGLALRQLGAADPARQAALERIHALEAELRAEGGRPLHLVARELAAERARLPFPEAELPFEAIAHHATARRALVYLADAGGRAFALALGGHSARPRCVGPAPLPARPWAAPTGPGAGPDDPLAALGAALIAPLAELLRDDGVAAATLIPCGQLGLWPLHAAPYAGGGGRRCVLLDELTVAYAPSARVLGAARARAMQRGGGLRLAGVGNPAGANLPGAEQELRAAARLLGAPPEDALVGPEATASALRAVLPGATVVHLACHASFVPGDPGASRLSLAGDEALTLAELLDPAFGALGAARLAVLSACQSARFEAEHAPDEVVGLPAGFLQAGAPAVVGTLWSVDDPSTALLMVGFYERVLAGAAPAAALCAAQAWLRDSTRYQLLAQLAAWGRQGLIERAFIMALWGRLNADGCPDPPFADRYYWAPFSIQGAAELPL